MTDTSDDTLHQCLQKEPERGWLLEGKINGQPCWWAAWGWTPDSTKAVRFARACDAELVRTHIIDEEDAADTLILEHMWS